jgi:hypothetical protein
MKTNSITKICTYVLSTSLLISCNSGNSTPTAVETQAVTPRSPEAALPSQSDISKQMEADNILERGKKAIKTINDLSKKNQIKDSIRLNHTEQYYALQIGPKLEEEEAILNYKRIVEAGYKSIYIFSISKMENYVVLFHGKGKNELESLMRDLKLRLGDYGTEGLQIINLYDEKYCTSNEMISKMTVNDEGMEVKYIICEFLADLDQVF